MVQLLAAAARLPPARWGLLFSQGNFPPSCHLYPCSMKCHFNLSFKKICFLLCAHHEGLFRKKKKSKLLVLPPSTPYKMSQVEKGKKKKKTLPNQSLLFLKYHVFIPARQKTAPSFQQRVVSFFSSPLNF